MKVIGINDLSHDVGVAYVKGKDIINATEEERFSRKKHHSGFLRGGTEPASSFEWILKKNKLKVEDIDYFAFCWNMNFFRWLENKISIWKLYNKTGINIKNGQLRDYPTGYIKKNLFQIIKEALYNYSKRNKYLKQFDVKKCKFVDHHLSHASLSYRCSNFDEALIFVVDGAGETKSTSIFIGNKNNIELKKSYPISQSIGTTYAIVTMLLGLGKDSEGKTMALADYGNPLKNIQLLEYSESKDKFLINTNQINELQKYKRKSDEPILQIHKDIAATLQNNVNTALMKFMKVYIKKYDQANICFCGGVSLNCKFNGTFINENPELNFFSPAASSDSGTAIGAALEITSQEEEAYKLNQKNFFLGYSNNKSSVLKFLKKLNLNFQKVNNYDKIVNDLVDGKIIGFCKDEAEVGPRALGNRSILTLASPKSKKDKVNLKIKHREKWRPFAIAILEDDLKYYFDIKLNSPFMNVALIANQKAIKEIPAVIHIDKSVRVQTVNKYDSPNLYKILKKLKERTGKGVLLNTSFNDKGEPIVNSYEDALRTFNKTGLEVLYLEDYRIEK